MPNKHKPSTNITITTKDCSPFPDDAPREALRFFLERNNSFSVLNIAPFQKAEEPLVSFNYQDKRWYAGRYVGSIKFSYNKTDYEIRIEPRFGNEVLFQMAEELFNIKFSSGASVFNAKDDNAYYLKKLISFVWLQKLAIANRHGLPRIKRTAENTSPTLKGKLLICPTLKTYYTHGKVVSSRKEQVFDQVVSRILFQAHNVLKKEYQLSEIPLPSNAQEAIQTFEAQTDGNSFVYQHEYNSIKYHPIYQNYKDLVDFSWQIIQSHSGYSPQGSQKSVSGFFLDMAEIWECYIRSSIKKHFSKEGWQLTHSQHTIYLKNFYRRKIIPDIVMQRENELCVFDAKYKNMQLGTLDVDREDFFQIHTYISYLQTKGDVVLGGLLYPLTAIPKDTIILPSKLYGNDGSKTLFLVAGPIVESQHINCAHLFDIIGKHITHQYSEK